MTFKLRYNQIYQIKTTNVQSNKRREEKCPPSCQLALSSELLAWARSYFHSTVCRKDSATEILTFYKYFNQSRPRFIDIFRMSQCSKCTVFRKAYILFSSSFHEFLYPIIESLKKIREIAEFIPNQLRFHGKNIR